ARRRRGRPAAVSGRHVRCAHLHLPVSLCRRSRRDATRACPGPATGRLRRRARVRGAAERCGARALAALRPCGPAARRAADLARLDERGRLPRAEHRRPLAAHPAAAPGRAVAKGGARGRALPPSEPRRRDRHLGPPVVSTTARPAFYALAPGGWRDYATLLHPPYTLWHLSYVAIGAALAPDWHPARLLAALAAFFLAVGIGAHALAALNVRPPATGLPDRVLAALAAFSVVGAVAIGTGGVIAFDLWLLAFVGAGVF